MEIKNWLERYGRTVRLCGADGWQTERYGALVQPLRYKNKMYLGGVHTPIGFNSEKHYMYIGPPNHDLTRLDRTDYLMCDGKKYIIDRAERVYFGEAPLYVWAVVREMVEEDAQ